MTAGSWRLPALVDFAQEQWTASVILYMCQFGMTQVDAEGEGLIMKPTRVLTNSAAIGE